MGGYTDEELSGALRPLESLLSKSEKAQAKVGAETWQYTMLRDNVAALRIAIGLIRKDLDAGSVTREELDLASRALADMTKRTQSSRERFAPGTSQHTLQRNRLAALRIAEDLMRQEREQS